jgi:hypothetical protein
MAASHMPLGIALPFIERSLAHTSGSFAASFDVYQRYEFVAEKRAVIEAWGIWLTGLTATQPQGICDLRHTLTFGILLVSASSAAKLSVSYGALFR